MGVRQNEVGRRRLGRQNRRNESNNDIGSEGSTLEMMTAGLRLMAPKFVKGNLVRTMLSLSIGRGGVLILDL